MKGTIAILTFVLATGCVDEPEPVPPPPVPTRDQCPEGFAPLGALEGCYREGALAGWITAEQACEQAVSLRKKAHLIIIDRPEEHAAISEMSKKGDMWIGRLQRDDDDEYRNINYIEWDLEYYGTGEPNDYGDGDCSGLSCDGRPGGGDERCIEYKTETGLWNDEKCYRGNRVICEWDNVDPYDWRPGSQGY
jgi:hypothetical protein